MTINNKDKPALKCPACGTPWDDKTVRAVTWCLANGIVIDHVSPSDNCPHDIDAYECDCGAVFNGEGRLNGEDR